MLDISLIVAKAQNDAIGKDNDLLWRIRDDLKRFKKLTSHHVVIHGRKSYESIGKPLPNRSNIVITRSKSYQAPGAFVCHTFDEAINLAKKLEHHGEIFVIGGARFNGLIKIIKINHQRNMVDIVVLCFEMVIQKIRNH